jgi:hypothetical protein
MFMFGVGALFAGVFGYRLYHWYFTGDLLLISRSGLSGSATYGESPVGFAIQFGIQALYFALGIACLAAAVIVPVHHRKRLSRTD